MNYEYLLVEEKNNYAIVTINRPDKLNALNAAVLKELLHGFQALADKDEVRAIILTGVGEKSFVAGADIGELHGLDSQSGREFALHGQKVLDTIENMNKPVIAAVNGYALGGGCEIALACHFRLASENVVFSQPEVNLGIIPGYGGTQRLAKIINPGRAMEYILTGAKIGAKEAYRLGLANHIFPLEELLVKAEEIAARIAGLPAPAVQAVIKAVNGTLQLNQQEGLDLEAKLFAQCCDTEDFKEGTLAFLEKRKAQFKHR